MIKPHLKRINNLWSLWESTASLRRDELPMIHNAPTMKIAYHEYVKLFTAIAAFKAPRLL